MTQNLEIFFSVAPKIIWTPSLI